LSRACREAKLACRRELFGPCDVRFEPFAAGRSATVGRRARWQVRDHSGQSLDRLSRDQEDTAAIYKRLGFAGVKIVTLSEGEISELHVGLKGTMNALYLKDLADKTRRGLRGRIEAGKSGGGNAYGYQVVHAIGADGEMVRGDRRIDSAQATVIRRIFKDYADGLSPRAIALSLNQEGVTGPTGKAWGPSTINGNRQRGTGIMDPELTEIFCKEYTEHMNRLRNAHVAAEAGLHAELARIARETDRIVQAICDGVPDSKVNDRMTELEARRIEVETKLANVDTRLKRYAANEYRRFSGPGHC
jgi:hypothetical protein